MSPIRLKPRLKLRIQFRRSSRISQQKNSWDLIGEGNEGKPTHWRKKLKRENPPKYEDVRKLEAAQSAYRRATMNEEQRERNKELCRVRVRRYRLRQKEERLKGTKKKITRKTKKEQETERKKWAASKKKERALWSEEKRRTVNEKRRMKRKQEKEELQRLRQVEAEKRKKLVEQEKTQQEQEKQDEQNTQQHEKEAEIDEASMPGTSRSTSSRRKLLSRMRVPSSPAVLADFLTDVITKASPRKAAAIRARGICLQSNLDQQIRERVEQKMLKTRHNRDKTTREVRRQFASTFSIAKKYKTIARKFGTTKKIQRNRADRYKGSHGLPREAKEAIESFYEANAETTANKKEISKKTLKKTAYLKKSIASLYCEFKKSHPEVKVSKSSFYVARPTHIKPMSQNKLNGCLCEYCQNIHLKLQCVNALCVKHSVHECRIKDEFDCSKMSLCSDKPACVNRSCKECGVRKVQEHLAPLLHAAEERNDKSCKWKRWERASLQNGTKKMTLVEKEGTLTELIEELCVELQPFSLHLFNWIWQHKAYQEITKDPPDGAVVMVMDFAENFRCVQQDEVQSAHWAIQQATVHPIVCTYKGSEEIITHSLVYISDDLQHDFNAVETFFQHAVHHLRNEHHLDINRIIRFSDGCGSQYKSRGPFLDISNNTTQTEHHYYGSRHGKGVSDGESAVIKRQASLSVAARGAHIPHAHSLFLYCQENLTRDNPSFKRDVFFIPSSSIDRNRPTPKCAVKNTRSIHAIRNTGRPAEVVWRKLSCFCLSCESGKGKCKNSSYVDEWNTALLHVDSNRDSPSTAAGVVLGTADVVTPWSADVVTPGPADVVTAGHANAVYPGPATSVDSVSADVVTTGPADANPDPTNTVYPSHATTIDPGPPDAASGLANTVYPGPSTAVNHGPVTSQPADPVNAGSFVLVRVPVLGPRKEAFYIAKVISKQDNNLCLLYMNERHHHLYTWPTQEHHFIHPQTDIIRVLEPPEPVLKGSRVFFQFHTEE